MDHSFDILIAQTYGIAAAILYRHFQFWIVKNKADGRNFHDGRTWCYITIDALCKQFPYLGSGQIRGALKKLIDAGILVKGRYNQTGYDQTTWYAFGDEKTAFSDYPAHLLKQQMDSPKQQIQGAKTANRSCKNGGSLEGTDNLPVGEPDNAKAFFFGLSGKATADASLRMRTLRRIGVIEDVAKSLAAVHSDAEVDQAIENGNALKLQQQGSGKPFNLAGYVVETLNTAREEGRPIKPTKLARQLKRKFAEKMRPTAKLTREQMEERRRHCIAQLAP